MILCSTVALFDAVLRTRKLGYIIEAAHGDYRTCLNGLMGGIYIILFQSVVLLFFQVCESVAVHTRQKSTLLLFALGGKKSDLTIIEFFVSV